MHYFGDRLKVYEVNAFGFFPDVTPNYVNSDYKIHSEAGPPS